jgi:hypothetical protein
VAAAAFVLGAITALLAVLRADAPPARAKWLASGLAGCAIVMLAVGWWFRPDPAHVEQPATLMLLDTSLAMGERLPDGATKLDAARTSVRHDADFIGQYEQFGLATYGVENCRDRSPYRMRLPFREAGPEGLAGRIDRAVTDLSPAGRSNLAVAASRALGRLQPFQEPKELVIITGTAENCSSAPEDDLALAIKKAHAAKVAVRWDIIGLGLTKELPITPDDQVRVHYAETSAELNDIVRQLVVIDPAANEFTKLTGFLDNEMWPEIKGALDALNARKPDEAGSRLDGLTRVFEKGERRFIKNQPAKGIQECEAVSTFGREEFKLVEDAIPVLASTVEFDRKHPGDLDDALLKERNDQVAKWNGMVDTYNTRISEDLPDYVKKCLEALGARTD